MSRSITTKKNLWKYYVKLSDFEAQCMLCENKYNYVKLSSFQKHTAKHHRKMWKYEEERKLMKWPWMYFKYLNKLNSQCIICDASVLSTSESARNHLNSHSEEQQKNRTYLNWLWKYCTKKHDFIVECNICYKILPLSVNSHLDYHLKMRHSNELKNMQETHDTVASSLETDIMSMSLNIATKNYLWAYYIKLSDCKAQCMFCKNKFCYLSVSHFERHIATKHREISKYEKDKNLIKEPWIYFKYSNKLYSQCIICDTKVPSTSKSLEDHLSSHSEKQHENIFRSWPWKYCTKRDDFAVECNICYKNLSLSIQKYLDFHIKTQHPDKLKNTQENTHDTVVSSKCASPLETDTMLLNIATKNRLWKYYVKLPNFEAQCMFCEKKYYYINSSNFQTHIALHHRKIWKYEEKRKLMQWSWMYFKYLNKLNSQCIICDASVPSTSKSVENHFLSHSKKQRENYVLRSWSWKYCTKRDDFVVKCNICQSYLSLTIHKYLDSHIKNAHLDKLENTQEAQDTVDSSERVSLLGTDTISVPLKNCYVLLTRCPPYNLYI